jgi:hypothetical protein
MSFRRRRVQAGRWCAHARRACCGEAPCPVAVASPRRGARRGGLGRRSRPVSYTSSAASAPCIREARGTFTIDVSVYRGTPASLTHGNSDRGVRGRFRRASSTDARGDTGVGTLKARPAWHETLHRGFPEMDSQHQRLLGAAGHNTSMLESRPRATRRSPPVLALPAEGSGVPASLRGHVPRPCPAANPESRFPASNPSHPGSCGKLWHPRRSP